VQLTIRVASRLFYLNQVIQPTPRATWKEFPAACCFYTDIYLTNQAFSAAAANVAKCFCNFIFINLKLITKGASHVDAPRFLPADSSRACPWQLVKFHLQGTLATFLPQESGSLFIMSLLTSFPLRSDDDGMVGYFNRASACFRAASLWPPSMRASSVTRDFLSSNRISEMVRPFFVCLVTM
jgi:hypothetical protein